MGKRLDEPYLVTQRFQPIYIYPMEVYICTYKNVYGIIFIKGKNYKY